MASRQRLTPQQIKDKDLYQQRRRKFTAKRNHAIDGNRKWTLKFSDIYWPTHCPILGIELDYFNPILADNSPSFDRINNNKGYTKENVLIISVKANRVKSNISKDELIKIVNWLTEQGSNG